MVKHLLSTFSIITLFLTLLPGSLQTGVGGQIEKPSAPSNPGIQTDSNVEFVSSHIGGAYHTIFVQDHLAYLGIGKSLVILNVADPQHNYVVGGVKEFGNEIAEVFVDQNRAYVTDGSRLWIIDVENPSQPSILGYFQGSSGCGGITAAGDHAYLACADAFISLDVSDAANPTLLDSLALPNAIYRIDRIKLHGSYVYIADQENGLRIIDISDPMNLMEAGSWSDSEYGKIRDVFIGIKNGKTIAYMISEWKHLCAADVTDPDDILIQGDIYSVDWPAQLFVRDDIAYVANQGGGLWVVDFSDLSAPVEVSSFDFDGMTFQIFMDGQVALLSNYLGGLELVDVSNLSAPQEIASYDEPTFISGIVSQDGMAYTVGAKGLGIYNVADPYNPKYTGLYKSADTRKVQVVDNTAYLGSLLGKFEIVDIQNPNAPSLVGDYAITTLGNIADVCNLPPPSGAEPPRIPPVTDFVLQGQYAYLANSEAGLRFLDIADPAHIIDLGTYKEADWIFITRIRMVGNVAYVLDSGCWSHIGALYIIDLSDLAHPSLIGSLPMENMSYDLEIQGTLGYVVTSYQNNSLSGLHVIDLQDLAHPQEIGFLADSAASAIDVQGNLVYMNSGSIGLRVIDVSDPTDPTQVGSYSVIYPQDVYHEGCVTYIAQWGAGMTLVGYQGDGEDCTISGEVQDSAGNPVSGVEISTNMGQSVKTGADGSYSIANLSVHQYDLTPSSNQPGQFYPNKRQVKLATDVSGQNFIMVGLDKRFYLPAITR